VNPQCGRLVPPAGGASTSADSFGIEECADGCGRPDPNLVPIDTEGWSGRRIADRRQAAFMASHSDFVSAIVEGRVLASPPSDHIENLRIALVAYGIAGWPA
jgi:hypothetical protein